MKSPPQQFTDDEARQKTEEFIRGDDEVVLPVPLKQNGQPPRKTKARNGTRAKL